jgi:DnaJ-class molecular chaperone
LDLAPKLKPTSSGRRGVDVPALRRTEFEAAYHRLARRFHPAANPDAHELMANIDAARSTILKSCRPD